MRKGKDVRKEDIGTNPHRALWQSVLLIAVDDALQGPEGASNRTTRLRLIEEARRYLSAPSRDLTTVCGLAGLDPQAVIDRMRQRIAQAPKPEELVSTRKASRANLTKRAEKTTPKRPRDRLLTLNGETMTVAQWAARIGVTPNAIHSRLAKGWTVEDALTLTADEAKHRARQSMQNRINAEVKGRTWKRGSPERLLTHNGQSLTIKQWSKITGLKIATIKARIGKGLTVAQALTPANLRGKSVTQGREAA